VQALLAALALLAFLPDNCCVATIVIRNLDPAVKRRLQVRAALNGRSMEAEAREVLGEVLEETALPTTGMQRSQRSRMRRRAVPKEAGFGTALHKLFASTGGVDLKIPPRTFSKRALPTFD
jgi:antitoxin FitA